MIVILISFNFASQDLTVSVGLIYVNFTQIKNSLKLELNFIMFLEITYNPNKQFLYNPNFKFLSKLKSLTIYCMVCSIVELYRPMAYLYFSSLHLRHAVYFNYLFINAITIIIVIAYSMYLLC